jgi:tetratricopeptide (TPR) repeat protein
LERRSALRTFKTLQIDERQRLELDESNLVRQSKLALKAGDQLAALHYWQEALVRYPEFARKSRETLDLLLDLERFDEAEEIMLEGRKCEPRDPYYAAGYALVAERRGQLDEAIQRWKRVRKKFPLHADGYVHATICLRRTGNLAEAAKLNQQAVKLFPDNRLACLEWASTAEREGDWPEAVRRWQTLSERFPVSSTVGVARALMKLGRLGEAEQLLKEAQIRRPTANEITIALTQLAARQATARGTMPSAQRAHERIPGHKCKSEL